MNRHIGLQRTVSRLLILGIFLAAAPALADRPWGMMGDGDHHGWTDQSGHMGWGGMGYGPMGGWGGMGMMGGMGMGMGMGGMGYGPMSMLDLSDKQREQISAIQKELRKDHNNRMDKMADVMENIQKLMAEDKRDTKAIVKAYEPMFALQRSMIETMVETMNKMEAVLTKEQREELKKYRHRGMAFGMMGR